MLRNSVGDGEDDGEAVETIWAAPPEDPEYHLLREAESANMGRLIESLPQQLRAVMVLREMEELSYHDIAEVLGLPIGTVMSRLACGRAMLREEWRRAAASAT